MGHLGKYLEYLHTQHLLDIKSFITQQKTGLRKSKYDNIMIGRRGCMPYLIGVREQSVKADRIQTPHLRHLPPGRPPLPSLHPDDRARVPPGV